MQKAQAVCERVGLEPDALVVLPFLDWREHDSSGKATTHGIHASSPR